MLKKIAIITPFYEESIPIGTFIPLRPGGFLGWPLRLRLLTTCLLTVGPGGICAAMHHRRLYRFLHGAGLSQRYFVQDICMPEQNIEQFLQFIDKTA